MMPAPPQARKLAVLAASDFAAYRELPYWTRAMAQVAPRAAFANARAWLDAVDARCKELMAARKMPAPIKRMPAPQSRMPGPPGG